MFDLKRVRTSCIEFETCLSDVARLALIERIMGVNRAKWGDYYEFDTFALSSESFETVVGDCVTN